MWGATRTYCTQRSLAAASRSLGATTRRQHAASWSRLTSLRSIHSSIPTAAWATTLPSSAAAAAAAGAESTGMTTEQIYMAGLAGAGGLMLLLAMSAAGSEDPKPASHTVASQTKVEPKPVPVAAAAAAAEADGAPTEESADASAVQAVADAATAADSPVTPASEVAEKVSASGTKIVCDRTPPSRVFTLDEVRADHGDETWVVLSDTGGVYNVSYVMPFSAVFAACFARCLTRTLLAIDHGCV